MEERDFDVLFLTYYPKVKNFIQGLIGSEEEAKNLTQDIFMRLWETREQAKVVHDFDAYLYASARHAAFHSIRNRQRKMTDSLEEAAEIKVEADVFDAFDTEELMAMIYKAVDKMPPRQRQCFLMSRKEGLPIAEISARLGINRRTVENHVSAALAALKKSLYLIFLNYFLNI